MEEAYFLIDMAIDEAFKNDRYTLNFYEYLKVENVVGKEVKKFFDSPVAMEVNSLIEELEDYLAGGDKQLIEAYKHVSKPRARKIKDYLHKILMDANRYEQDKRPGRKKGSKNKKRQYSTHK